MARQAQTSVIIPVYNLVRRGLERVKYSLYSIALNTVVPDVVVMDGSTTEQYEKLNALIKDFPFVEHVHYPQQRYNMPILFNRGIERTNTPYLFCTGADFLYRRDFFECLENAAHENCFIIVPVRMLPPCKVTEQAIKRWELPPSRPNSFGEWADGLQYFHRWWYEYSGGYDERMHGWGGMDNDHHFRAKCYGLNCQWLEGTEVLHIWHETEKASGPDKRNKLLQSRANWQLRDTDRSIRRNLKVKKEISYQVKPGKLHKASVIVRDKREKTQATWSLGNFYETQRHGMLNFVYERFQGGTFIDIGASIGNHSLFFATCCNADKVFAFEPVKDVFDHLLDNIKANETENIYARNIAIGDKKGEVGITFSNLAPELGGMLVGRVDEPGSGVRMETLDDVLREEQLDEVKCLKIDVEGYNLPVLKGAKETIEKHHPAIFCECETEESFKEVDTYLSKLGYKVWEINGKPFAMNHTPTYLWEFEEEVDITIIITTYNRPDALRQLIEGLIADATDYRVKCVVYSDGSDLAYERMSLGNEKLKVKYINLPWHHGKTEYWKLINRVYQDMRSTSSSYYIQLPDDVQIKPGFIAHAVNTYRSIEDPGKMCLNLYLDDFRLGRPNWTKMMPRIEKYGEVTVFRLGWVDMCYIAERKFFEALDFEIKPVSKDRWKDNPMLSSGVGKQITERLKGNGMYQVRDCYLKSTDISSVMNPDRPENENLSICQVDPILCGVASIPDRSENLRLTVISVLPFVDELHVYLNNYPAIPAYLNHPKISVYKSQDHGDLGDAGKFFTVGKKRGFYFAIDDDIIYPKDFVWKLVNEIRHYRKVGRKVAVGLHGKVMPVRIRHYYKDHVRQYHGAYALDKKKGVHILATCALAFHTDDLKITIDDFKGPQNMADIHFSIACQKNNVGCVVLPRPDNYIKIQKIPIKKTIWGQYHMNDKVQTDLYNSWKDWRIRV